MSMTKGPVRSISFAETYLAMVPIPVALGDFVEAQEDGCVGRLAGFDPSMATTW